MKNLWIFVLAVTPLWMACGGSEPAEEVAAPEEAEVAVVVETTEETEAPKEMTTEEAGLAQPMGAPAGESAYPIEVCVVSDHGLDAMGEPIKVEHEGRTVMLCCEGCVDGFNEDPTKYVAKLDELAASVAASQPTE